MKEGYLTISAGHQKYFEMAVSLCLSLKTFDEKRSVCLLYDDHIDLPSYAGKLFDEMIMLAPDDRFSGCMNKIRLYEYSPFERSMFVDADAILMKRQVDAYWDACSGKGFSLPGGKRSAGRWEPFDIEDVCRRFDCQYIVDMNSGTFYFERGPIAESLFAEVHRLYVEDRDDLCRFHRNQPGHYTDDPFFGVAMGRLGLEPTGIDPRVGSWMVTTWRARRCAFDIEAGVSTLEKPVGYWWPSQALFPKGWVKHSPVFVHFIGLQPRAKYQHLATQLKQRHAHRFSTSDLC